MSYLKRVEKQRRQNRLAEERRKARAADAKNQAWRFGDMSSLRDAQSAGAANVSAGIPKAPPAERARCGKWSARFWRCGMPRGHGGGCIRRDLVTKQIFDAELVAMAERKAAEEAAKTKALTPPSAGEDEG